MRRIFDPQTEKLVLYYLLKIFDSSLRLKSFIKLFCSCLLKAPEEKAEWSEKYVIIFIYLKNRIVMCCNSNHLGGGVGDPMVMI